MVRSLRRRVLAAAAVVAGVSAAFLASPAVAGVAQTALVSTNPANYTPNANNGAVYAYVQIGSTEFAGGDFTSVTPAAGGSAVTRNRLVAFSATTGALTSFATSFNGTVLSLATDGVSLYVGGSFTTAGGVARPYLAKVNPTTGAVDTAFNAGLNKQVAAAKVVGSRLLIGGDFTGSLRGVDLATGANTGYIATTFTSTLGANGGAVGISRFAVNSAGTRLVAIGNFTSIGGASHIRAAMFTLGTSSGAVNTWNYTGLADSCQLGNVPNYLRDVDFAPDGTYFVIVGTGRNPATATQQGYAICDAAARFETGTATVTTPTWINYTGGDTLLAVNITSAAVYVQGHFRWLNNEGGSDSQGPNGVSRPGIGALNVTTGRALSWNPTKDRGVGGKVLYTTSSGLWVGSDTTHIGGETHARIAFLPL